MENHHRISASAAVAPAGGYPYNPGMTTPNALRIGLLGLGAVGTVMAWRWRQCSLFALGREPVQARTLTLDTFDGQREQFTLPAWDGSPLDWLVITTKAGDTLPALQPWLPYLTAVKRLLLLQNGMGQHEAVAGWLQHQALPCELWAGVSTEGAYRLRDNSQMRVVHAGAGATQAGPLMSELMPELVSDSRAELPPAVTLSADIRQPMREKLAINAIINPLTSLLRCANGELVDNPGYLPRLLALADEIAGLYQALGWPLSTPLRQRAMAVATATGANRSSTLQDILAGRATELPWICGYLLHCAEEIQYPLPLTQAMYEQLQNGA